MSVARSGPLRGIRIIELPAVGPVPLFGTICAEYGATVLRIDRPPTLERKNPLGIHQSNRPTLPLDLKEPGDRDRLLELVATADILVEGYRPGVMERLGLGPDVCQACNQRLVYGRMTGWGQEGPLAQDPGHDINYLALSGILSAIGTPERPVLPLNLLGDYGGGTMLLATGVLAAVIEAQRSGQGQVIDVAMLDGINLQASVFYEMQATGFWSVGREENMLDGGAPFYGCYRCADGKWLAVGPTEMKFRANLAEAIGVPALGAPASNDKRNWPALRAEVAAAIAGRSLGDWMARLAGIECCVTPVLDMKEAPLHPHAVARGAYRPIKGGWTPSPAPRFSRTPAQAVAAPSLEDVLAEFGKST